MISLLLTLLPLLALLVTWRWWRTRSAAYQRHVRHLVALELAPEGVKLLAREVAKRAVELLVERAGVSLPAGSLPCLAELAAETSKKLTAYVAFQLLLPRPV